MADRGAWAALMTLLPSCALAYKGPEEGYRDKSASVLLNPACPKHS